MSKRAIALISLLILAVALVWFWNKGYFVKQEPGIDYATKIFGDIKEIGKDYIVVQGGVGNWDPREMRREIKIIRFLMNSDTVFTKKAIIIPANTKPGDTFYPEVRTVQGSFSDLYVGLAVGVIAKENLFTKEKAKALEVIYETIER